MQLKMWFRSLGFVLMCMPMSVMVATPSFAKEKKSEGKKGEGKKKGKGKKDKEEDGEDGGSYKAPYGMAGCGLGSTIFHDDSKGAQITAATLNGTGMQTSAISCTHSSNCKADAKEAAIREQEVFVAANLRALEVDVSAGGGDYSRAFAEVLGCGGDSQYDQFMQMSRTNYQTIFSSEDPKEVYENYLHVLRAEGKLADGCARVFFKT